MRKTRHWILVGMILTVSLVYAFPAAYAQNWVQLRGSVTLGGQPVCGLVLANGQFQFSCNPIGQYSLFVPLDANSQITLFAFADGMLPYKNVLSAGQGVFDVRMSVCGVSSCTATLRVQNVGTRDIWYVYVSPSTDTTWGPDRLGSNDILRAGATLSIPNLPGNRNYDLRAVYQNGHSIEQYNVHMACGQTLDWRLNY